MAHFMDCILSDQEQKIAVDRDDRTGVNYLCWFETNDGGRVLHRWYCPMFGADGKPLVTDIAGNIRPEQQFNEKEFISNQGLTENNDKKHFEKYCRRIGIGGISMSKEKIKQIFRDPDFIFALIFGSVVIKCVGVG